MGCAAQNLGPEAVAFDALSSSRPASSLSSAPGIQYTQLLGLIRDFLLRNSILFYKDIQPLFIKLEWWSIYSIPWQFSPMVNYCDCQNTHFNSHLNLSAISFQPWNLALYISSCSALDLLLSFTLPHVGICRLWPHCLLTFSHVKIGLNSLAPCTRLSWCTSALRRGLRKGQGLHARRTVCKKGNQALKSNLYNSLIIPTLPFFV